MRAVGPYFAMSMSIKLSKRRRLQALYQEIRATIPDPWVFPTKGTVKGFMGTGAIMFVAERPSTGHFPSRADGLLYSLLEKYGVSDSHLTDVIKSRGKVGEPYPDDIALHRRVFDREIEIVCPRLIVAFGQKVSDLLQFSLAGSRTTIRQVWHYSYAQRWPEARKKFESQLREALQS